MSANKFINLEELEATTQALLIKINEQSALKVDKNQVAPANIGDGILIGTIAGESFYAPQVDLSAYPSYSDLYNGLAPIAWSGNYNDLYNRPTIPSTAADIGISSYVSSFNGSSGAITYTAPVSSVNGATGSVVVSKIKTSGWNEMVEFALTGTYTSNDNSVPTELVNLPWATFNKSTSTYARLTLGSNTTPGVVRLRQGASYDLIVNTGGPTTGVNTIKFQAASGTVAFVSDINTAISSAISTINSFQTAIVSALPTSNIDTHTIYFLSTGESSPDSYNEYMYINNTWERVGGTSVTIPTNVSAFVNDVGYITLADLPIYDGSVI